MSDKNKVPRHVAIIMDGNGRWAKERGLPRSAGHREGIKRIEEILKTAADAGVKLLTLFAFSTENWKRPKVEIGILTRSLSNFLERRLGELMEQNVRFMVIGRRRPIPDYLWQQLDKTQDKTKDNNGLTVILAFNYGARQEIADAAKRAAQEVLEGRLSIEDLNEGTFGKFLYTASVPDPDFLIRTSGELRLSNFLLWQLSYAEFYFTDTYWPDFGKKEFVEALKDYANRSRRFGAAQ
jgi:undecaprenyl diphosphate synthase